MNACWLSFRPISILARTSLLDAWKDSIGLIVFSLVTFTSQEMISRITAVRRRWPRLLEDINTSRSHVLSDICHFQFFSIHLVLYLCGSELGFICVSTYYILYVQRSNGAFSQLVNSAMWSDSLIWERSPFKKFLNCEKELHNTLPLFQVCIKATVKTAS